ncbi:SdrD B-like domain-containing protein [Methanolapillus millepedarum]|uniref:SD-repeat containing protein B domain-containing protein n=1 Tax=Methanolapillus millepedarum TaxID=3028296 RepID=A0AA96V282_9EURY|nr:hypothetical protein MsAc7_06030 [Methanosarcinaceae archaeon Ac7]
MGYKNSMKRISISLLIVMILMATFIMPAAADDAAIDGSWKDPVQVTTTDRVILLNTSSKITFDVNIPSGFTGTNVLNISLKNNNTSEPDSGFSFSDYTAKNGIPSVLSGTITNVDSSSDYIEYTFQNVEGISFDVSVFAGSTAYSGEKADIMATLYQDSTEVSNLMAAVVCQYPQLTTTGTINLINPILLPSGKNGDTSVRAQYVYSGLTGAAYNSTTGFKLNFSTVNITVDGVTKTYENWMLDPTTSPVIFYLDETNMTSVTPLTEINLTAPQTQSFIIWISEDFQKNGSNVPEIDFTSLSVTSSVQMNGRGSWMDLNTSSIGYTDGSYVSHTIDSKFTAVDGQFTRATFYKAVSTGDYLLNNSKQYSSSSNSLHPLYYQELFRIGFEGSVLSGEDITMEIEVPDNVTITHIRLPKNGDDTQYSSIKITDPVGNEYLFDQPSLSSDQINLSSEGLIFGPGDDVTLEIIGLLKMRPVSSGHQSYSFDHLIHFVGITDSISGNQKFSYSMRGDNTGTLSDIAGITLQAVDGYNVTPYIHDFSVSGTLEPGKSLKLTSKFDASSYPYYSALRTNPLNPVATSVYPNPVAYFSIPPGLAVKNVSLYSGNTLGSSVFDKDGNQITFETKTYPNAGVYKNDTDPSKGGQLVEVKLKKTVDESERFWLQFNPSHYTVQFDLEVPDDYDEMSITFKDTSVLWTTWDPDATESGTGGSGGRNSKLEDCHISGTSATVSQGSHFSYSRTLSTTLPNVLVTGVSTNTSGGYVSYRPGVSDSYPRLMPGNNSDFKLYAINYGTTSYSDSKVYFILPKSNGWKPVINGPLTVVPSSGLNDDDYSVFYTTDKVTDSALNDNGDFTADYTWTEITFDIDKKSETDLSDLNKMTAVKVVFNTMDNRDSLRLYLPFEVPNVPEINASNNLAIGQTLYRFNQTFKSNSGFTGAVQLMGSDGPIILGHNTSADSPTALGTSTTVKTGDPIPDWWTIYTYDDFTKGINLSKVDIIFTPDSGPASKTSITEFTNEEYIKKISGADDPNFAPGNKVTIPEASRIPVNSGTQGTYLITYYTKPDEDGQVGIATRTIIIRESNPAIEFDEISETVLWNTNVPSGSSWDEYFHRNVTGEGGVSLDQNNFTYESCSGKSTTFDINTPGSYILTYRYTDGTNTAYVDVNVVVKYNGTLSGNVTANGKNVSGQEVTINDDGPSSGGSNTTTLTGAYSYPLEAFVNPEEVSYTVSVGTPPAGLKVPTLLISPQSGIAKAPKASYTADFDLEPVGFNVSFVDASGWVESVTLYNSAGQKQMTINTSDNSGKNDYLFEKASGDGWFEGDDYYFVLKVQPGFKPDGSAFNQKEGPSLEWKTGNYTLGNEDISVSGGTGIGASYASGVIWNDKNKDSIFDRENESLVSNVTVSLLDNDNVSVSETKTDANGYYYLHISDVGNYYVQVKPPAGLNRASAFHDDQKINGSDNYKSYLLEVTAVSGTSADQFSGVLGGFYYEHTSGGRVGTATITGLLDAVRGNDSGNNGNDSEGEGLSLDTGNQTGDSENNGNTTDPGTKRGWGGDDYSFIGLLIMLSAIILGLRQLFTIYGIRSGKVADPKKLMKFHILAVIMAIFVVIAFFYFYNWHFGKIIYRSPDIILAAFFIIEILLTAKAYRKNEQKQRQRE